MLVVVDSATAAAVYSATNRELQLSSLAAAFGGNPVTARCYSACAYTLAGGKRRIVPDGSSVGVHRAWTARTGQRDITGTGTIDAQVATEGFSPVLARYLRMMGVSGQLVALADATPSSEIRVLTRAELSRLRVVTPQARERRGRS